MLILTRRIGQSIMIGNGKDVAAVEAKVTILGIQGQNVRIGIDASEDIPVHREEIYNKIKKGEGRD